jgi:hypothetical protein
MEESKSTVLPPKHVVEVTYGKFKMKLYNPRSVTLSVSIRKATKSDI